MEILKGTPVELFDYERLGSKNVIGNKNVARVTAPLGVSANAGIGGKRRGRKPGRKPGRPANVHT